MSRRRFRIGVHEYYDARFDNRKKASQILNPLGNQISWLVFEMGDEHGVAGLLAECKAKLCRAEKAVAECDIQFEELKAMRAKAGRTIPQQRDQQAQAQYLDGSALVDVTGEEVDKLTALLAKFKNEKKSEQDAFVLKYGPCGTGKIGEGNVLCVLDGQVVGVNDNGLLKIDDDRSPYNHMLVSDYKEHLVRPWLAKHKRTCTSEWESLPPWPAAVPREKTVVK